MHVFEKWMQESSMPNELQHELKFIMRTNEEIEDRFYQYLSFGTGGMRGLLGAGTNRMNVYTIRRVAEGLAQQVIASEKRLCFVELWLPMTHVTIRLTSL